MWVEDGASFESFDGGEAVEEESDGDVFDASDVYFAEVGEGELFFGRALVEDLLGGVEEGAALKAYFVGGDFFGGVAAEAGCDDVEGEGVYGAEDGAEVYGEAVGGAGAFHGGDAVHEVELGGKVVVEVEEKVGEFFLGVEQGVLFGFVHGGEEAKGVFDGSGEEHESVGFEFGQGDDEVGGLVGFGDFDFVFAGGGV